MAERVFGVNRAAGTRVIERQGQPAIQPGLLGSTVYSGITQKGPPGRPFRVSSTSNYRFRAGNFIPESLIPDAASDFFSLGQGRGSLYIHRITDGSEKKAYLSMKNRRNPRSSSLLFEAGNGGRWGGKKQTVVDEYASVTPTSVTLSNIPAGLKEDELVGAKVKFSAIPGKSFDVISSSELGVLTFPSDVDVVSELGASLDKLLSVELLNDGLAIGILIKDGQDSPIEEWGLEVYTIEGGVATRRKNFPNLSSDPSSSNYYAKIINDDPDRDFLLSVTDQHVGAISADIRPANVFGQVTSLTDTVLSAKIHDEIVSAVSGATAKADPLTLGASVIQDEVTLTLSAVGARSSGLLTFGANPADGDSVTINGKAITFRTTVADATSEVLIGGTAEESLDNFLSFLNSSSDSLLKDLVFGEKASASTVDVYAQSPGLAGDSITTISAGGGSEPTWGAGTLSGGADQTWDYVSKEMPFVTGLTVTTGVAFAAPNDFASGFTIVDTTKDSTKEFAVGDTIKLFICPLELGKLVDGVLIPNASLRRIKFKIVENTANTITVKAGSNMLANASVGDDFRVEYIQELGGGYDGVATISDLDFVNAYDTETSPLKSLRGQNLGLIKLASPGVTSITVQKAGVAFGQANNWQYRYEIPANITQEDAVEVFINDQLGRNDYAVVQFPSFAKVLDPSGQGLKLISQTGAIHGLEALTANNFEGFHKAAAGVDHVIPSIVALPDGFEGRTIDEEFLDPVGVNFLKFKDGNFILWGDETVGTQGGRKFKHKREYLSHIENIFLENFDFIIFSINDEQSDKLLESAFRAFFIPEFAKRAVRGASFEEAVQIKIDSENNTDLTRSLGQKFAEIQIRIADTTKQFIITISELGVTESAA